MSSLTQTPLRTDFGNPLLLAVRSAAIEVLLALNENAFRTAREIIGQLQGTLGIPPTGQPEDALLDDLYVLQRYADFLLAYVNTWSDIVERKFSSSWRALQDSLDLLRAIKRYSSISVAFFETQLLALEKAYPYNVFFSTAIVVDYFSCSVCGRDIDSDECPHTRRQLCAGAVAYGIAENVREVTSVSMVTHPRDKRCVVKYDDDGEQFAALRQLSSLITEGRLRIAQLGTLIFSEKKKLNPDFKKLGRNQLCYCGSGKKFKNCCISNAYIDGLHIQVALEARPVEELVD